MSIIRKFVIVAMRSVWAIYVWTESSWKVGTISDWIGSLRKVGAISVWMEILWRTGTTSASHPPSVRLILILPITSVPIRTASIRTAKIAVVVALTSPPMILILLIEISRRVMSSSILLVPRCVIPKPAAPALLEIMEIFSWKVRIIKQAWNRLWWSAFSGLAKATFKQSWNLKKNLTQE